jgi:hypothetical protein
LLSRKKLAIGLGSVAIAGAALVPAIAGAAGTTGTPSTTVAISQETPDEGGPSVGPGFGRGFRAGFALGRHGGGYVYREVLEQFDVDRDELRAALETVHEQLPVESRPDVEPPLDDAEKAELEAFAVTWRATLATALGIPTADFEAAFQTAKAEHEAERDAHRTERLQALADALGITVEQLQAAMDQARATLEADAASGS